MNQQYTRIRRTVNVPCPACWGRMHTNRRCPICNDTGEVARIVNEIVPVTGDEDSEAMISWAGAHV